VVALALSIASISALEPLVLKAVFDSFLRGHQLAQAALPLGMLIAAALVRDSLGLIQERLFWKTRLAINFSLLRATVDRLHSLPLSYHRDQSVGATMTKIEPVSPVRSRPSRRCCCSCFRPSFTSRCRSW